MKMNKKVVLTVLIAFLGSLCIFSSLFVVFANAVPEGTEVEENYLSNQNFANSMSGYNQQIFPLSENGKIKLSGAVPSPAETEIFYDDGTVEHGWYWLTVGSKWAVRFTPPFSGALLECRFYIVSNPATVIVHVYDSDKIDIITPFSVTPTSTGWFTVDLSTYGITVSEEDDFYIGIETTEVAMPSLGADHDAPDFRSWRHGGTTWDLVTDRDYMIRATIESDIDLVITNLYLDPADPDEGDLTNFKASVENQGTGDANDFVVQMYLDDELYVEGTHSLAAGDSITYFQPWTATPGSHTLRCVIDATDVIDETDENNNEMTIDFGVGEYLTVNSPYGTPGGEDWYNHGATAYATLDTGTVDEGNGIRRIFTHWSGDASGTNFAQSNPITMDGPKTAIANWKTQYYLTMVADSGTVSPMSGWYDAGATVSISATAPTVTGDEQYGWDGWTGTGAGSYSGTNNPASITMNAPITQTATWRREYYLTVTSAYGTPSPESGWVEAGTPITISSGSPASGPDGTRYLCTGWTGTGSVPATGTAASATFTMEEPSSITWNWKTQYYLTMETSYGSVSPTSGWYDAGATVSISATAPAATGDERYGWAGWTGTGTGSTSSTSNPASVTMNGPITQTATWRREYYLTVTSAYGTPSPESGWVEAGTPITISSGSPASGPDGTRYLCTGWTGTGSVPATGTAASATFTMDQTSSITWNWNTQYYLTMETNNGTVTPESGWYDPGSTVVITATAPTATPQEQYYWLGWTGTGSGSTSSTDNPASITMNAPITQTAAWRYEYTPIETYIQDFGVSSNSIAKGGTIIVSGSISLAQEVTITLTYTMPDGTKFNRTTTASDGTFSHSYTADMDGEWSVQASWPGDSSYAGCESGTMSFKVKSPGILDDPDIWQVILAVVGIALSVAIIAGAWYTTHRKRGHVKELLDQIDDAFFRFKRNTRRCEAELYRLRDIVLESYKSGAITEASYSILNSKIDDYLSKLVES